MNYNFMYEIEQTILNKLRGRYKFFTEPHNDDLKNIFYSEFKRNMNYLERLTRGMKVKPGNISSIDNDIDEYNFMVKTEQGNITVRSQKYRWGKDMRISINDENKRVDFRTFASLLDNLTGHYETNEGMFILRTIPPLDESIYSKPGMVPCTLKIHFYDTEAMSYTKDYWKEMWSPEDFEYYIDYIERDLNQKGIFPDEEMTLTTSIEGVIELANEFYLEPNRLINMMRMANAKENTEGRQIKH